MPNVEKFELSQRPFVTIFSQILFTYEVYDLPKGLNLSLYFYLVSEPPEFHR
jgi:hypothetical protein